MCLQIPRTCRVVVLGASRRHPVVSLSDHSFAGAHADLRGRHQLRNRISQRLRLLLLLGPRPALQLGAFEQHIDQIGELRLS